MSQRGRVHIHALPTLPTSSSVKTFALGVCLSFAILRSTGIALLYCGVQQGHSTASRRLGSRAHVAAEQTRSKQANKQTSTFTSLAWLPEPNEPSHLPRTARPSRLSPPVSLSDPLVSQPSPGTKVISAMKMSLAGSALLAFTCLESACTQISPKRPLRPHPPNTFFFSFFVHDDLVAFLPP